MVTGRPHDNSQFIDRYQGRLTIFFDVRAPGYGGRTYKITKIDDKGLWGYLLKDESVRINTGYGKRK